MDRKKLYILIALLILVLLIVGVGAYLLWGMGVGGGGNGGNGGNGNGTPNVADATSLQFSVDVTAQGTTATYKYAAKNAGTDQLMLRIDILGGEEGDYAYILNGVQKKAWAFADGEWTDVSEAYSTWWDAWNPFWEEYHANLVNWTGTGDWTYTSPTGESVRIYSIAVNPALPDSFFQPS